MQPLSFVENDGFVKLVKKLDPRYQLPSRPTVAKSLLPKRHENLKDVVKCELMRVKHAALTIDL